MSFPPYETYKDSGVEWLGDVPRHWRTGKIRQFAKLESGHTPSRQHPEWWENCTIPWFSLGDVWQIREGRATYVYETKEFVSELGLANSSARLLPKGTVILSRTASVGFSAIMGCDMATTQDFANWVCGPDVTPEFLLMTLRAMKGEFDRLMMGSTHQTIYMPDIAKLALAVPPRNEQLIIIPFLDRETAKIDALVEEQQRLIALLEEKRQAVISHAVTKGLGPNVPMKESGVEWLGEVPAHWEVKPLGQLCEKIGSGKTPKGGSEVYASEGVLFLRSQNVYDEGLFLDEVVYIADAVDVEMASTRVRPGDILLNITGASLGRTCLVPPDFKAANVNQHVCIIRLQERNLCAFVAMALKASSIKAQIDAAQTGAAREGLNFVLISALRISIPPLNELPAICSFIEGETAHFNVLISEAKSAIALLQERRSALISAAVTGKIDVRGLAPQSAEAA